MRNSVDFLKQHNSDSFNVSCPGGAKLLYKNFNNGTIEVAVSAVSPTYPIIIDGFQKDFKIVACQFQTFGFGKASHAVSLYNTSRGAAGFIATMVNTASRGTSIPTVLNFNKVNISAGVHKLKLTASGASWAAKVSGVLILKTRPI